MKHLLYLAVFTLTLCACEKQDFSTSIQDQGIEQSNELASITVEVLLQEANGGNSSNGNCGEGTTCSSVYSALVSLYPVGTTEVGDQKPLFSSQTDIRGQTIFKDLPEEGYTIFVDCYYGKSQKEVSTPRGSKRIIGFLF
ncbi:MAG: hypothetical protein DHS20C18_00320 [Saprospiraceae bacterium]|nr:MAG: hypothetical protein DHS20C18_00320 [Saprospiraceae bacterium]